MLHLKLNVWIVTAIFLTFVSLASCSSVKTSDNFELGEEVVPPSGCQILRKQVEEENKKNGTNKEAKC